MASLLLFVGLLVFVLLAAVADGRRADSLAAGCACCALICLIALFAGAGGATCR